MLLPFALVGASPSIDVQAFRAVELYILIYGVMNLGAFAVLTAMARESPSLLMEDFTGLIRRSPVLAGSMTVFLISLAGIPPTAGFFAKLVVFSAAVAEGGRAVGPWLAAVMVINSVISVGYYIGLTRQMIFVEGDLRPFRSPALITGMVLVAAVTVFAVFIYPDMFARFPQGATLVAH